MNFQTCGYIQIELRQVIIKARKNNALISVKQESKIAMTSIKWQK